MDGDNKRVDISDLPRPEEELTAEEAKNVQGGLTKVGVGTLTLNNSSTANSTGVSATEVKTQKVADGSV